MAQEILDIHEEVFNLLFDMENGEELSEEEKQKVANHMPCAICSQHKKDFDAFLAFSRKYAEEIKPFLQYDMEEVIKEAQSWNVQ